jgi:hypothetical protein
MYWGGTKEFEVDWSKFLKAGAGFSAEKANYVLCICFGRRRWGGPKIEGCECCPGPDGYVYFPSGNGRWGAHRLQIDEEDRALGRAKRPLRDPRPRIIREIRAKARYGWATFDPATLNKLMLLHCQSIGNLHLVREYTMVRSTCLCSLHVSLDTYVLSCMHSAWLQCGLHQEKSIKRSSGHGYTSFLTDTSWMPVMSRMSVLRFLASGNELISTPTPTPTLTPTPTPNPTPTTTPTPSSKIFARKGENWLSRPWEVGSVDTMS